MANIAIERWRGGSMEHAEWWGDEADALIATYAPPGGMQGAAAGTGCDAASTNDSRASGVPRPVSRGGAGYADIDQILLSTCLPSPFVHLDLGSHARLPHRSMDHRVR